MRILYVCTDADIGGAERFLATLGRWRHPGDAARLVVLMQPGSLSDVLESSFDEVVYLGFPPTSRNLPGMVRALNAQIAEYRPDVLSSHLFHADLVTALARSRAPKTTTIHTQGFGPGDHPLTKLIARAVGLLSFRFAAVIPAGDSPAMAGFIRRLRMRNVVPPIRNGAELPAEPRFTPASRVFLSLARNHPVKGHAVLFDAFSRIAERIPEWSLHAYGPGITAQDEAMRDALGAPGRALLDAGRIRLGGPTSTPDAELAASSALVIASTYGEAFPIVGAEAAAAGIPVITTDVGSCAEFADDPRFLVAPGDPQALADAMLAYAGAGDAERSALSAAARRRAQERYSPAVVVEAYRAVFSAVIARKGAS